MWSWRPSPRADTQGVIFRNVLSVNRTKVIQSIGITVGSLSFSSRIVPPADLWYNHLSIPPAACETPHLRP